MTRTPGRPLLAATLIVRDEADNLPATLAALHGLVDEVVVYDTGSHDGTQALATAAGARVLQGYWDGDFARARNAALDMTRAEWVLIVDADERPVGDVHGLRAYLSGTASAGPGTPPAAALDLIVVDVVNVGHDDREIDALTSVRLARRDGVRWHGTVHEHLRVPGLAAGTERRLYLPRSAFHLRHHGYADPVLARAKAERNLAIAQAELDALVASGSQDSAAAARVLLDLGRSCVGAGRRQDAVDAFETLRELVPSGLRRAQASAMLAQVLLDEGGLEEAALVLEEELRGSGLADPRYCDWLKAQALARLGHRDVALDLLRGIDQLVDPVGNRYPVGPVLVTRTLLATSAGRVEEAAEALLEAMAVHGEAADHGPLLLQLWEGREEELVHRVMASGGRYVGDLLARLAELGDGGQRVAALAGSTPAATVL